VFMGKAPFECLWEIFQKWKKKIILGHCLNFEIIILAIYVASFSTSHKVLQSAPPHFLLLSSSALARHVAAGEAEATGRTLPSLCSARHQQHLAFVTVFRRPPSLHPRGAPVAACATSCATLLADLGTATSPVASSGRDQR
jgi:hypothetical protein